MLSKLRATKKRRAAEKAGLCPQCGRRHLAKNRKQCAVCIRYRRNWSIENRTKLRNYARKYVRELRRKVLILLGGKCANPKCRHLNGDMTLGCTDLRILHIDHKKGGGNKDRLKMWSQQILKKVLSNPKKFQLLCPTCNWIKRIEEKEYFRAVDKDPITKETYYPKP
jgi:hypothetical protein